MDGPHRNINTQDNMTTRGAARILALVLLFVPMHVAKSQPAESPPSSSAGSAQATLQKIRVRFTWQLAGYYAPLFVALERGYFRAEGLDVEFAEGNGSETVIKLIAVGTDKIAYGPAIVAAQAVSRGLPVKVIAIYQRRTPIGLMSFPDIPLKTPKDLEGRTLGLTASEAFTQMLAPFARLNNIDLAKIKVIQLDSSARNSQFMVRKLDTMTVYIIDEIPLMEKRAGVKFNVLSVSDFGLALLGQSYIVNDEFARSNPDVLRRLLRATAKGFADVIRDPKGAAAIMNKHRKIPLDPDVAEEQTRLMLQWTDSPAGKPFGWQEEADWVTNLDLLKRSGAVAETRDLQAYYTNEYLE
jgi:ABC-type nitrate/sulfonate/bicarbonate transport system substrate-binding protein